MIPIVIIEILVMIFKYIDSNNFFGAVVTIAIFIAIMIFVIIAIFYNSSNSGDFWSSNSDSSDFCNSSDFWRPASIKIYYF